MSDPSCGPGLALMALNTCKAGMAGLDREGISRVIEEASRGSKFYAKKAADQARIQLQVDEMLQSLASLGRGELSAARLSADTTVARLRRSRRLDRVIVHVDMDMFYAAVEMRDNPALSEVAMGVGGMGMLSTSNYKARKFGVRAAMPGFIAKKLCPELVIVPCNMAKYAAVAEVVRSVFCEYDPDFCPMSLDEAYLDITALVEQEQQNMEEQEQDPQEAAAAIVTRLRGEIKERTGLTASAGIACNARLAKVASDLNKPDGQHQVLPEEQHIQEFVSGLSIRKVGGIGNVSEQLLNSIGVQTCRDIYDKRAEIKLLFSEISFEFYMEVSQGLGSTSIQPPEERDRKSISTETTFRDTSERSRLLEVLAELCRDLARDMVEKDILGLAVTVKIKSHDFKLKTKVAQLCDFTNSEATIFPQARRVLVQLLDSSPEQPLALRLMGVRMSELRERAEVRGGRQTSLRAFVSGGARAVSRLACPVCQQPQVSLAVLNIHMDECVSYGCEDSELMNTGSEDIGINTAGSEDIDINTAGSEVTDVGDSVAEASNSEIKVDSNCGKLVKVVPSTPDLSAAPSPQSYLCPVCFSSQKFSSEKALSDHVEDCLSRQEVRNIVKEETEKQRNSGKRKADVMDHQKESSKKIKSTARIDDFFARC